ncbi:DUF6913 domain-containing protein [Chondrinema litorale]|uniref:DUF6913 domain-containing protein n=1 Tax=Chondrinema litorale TaxID=2994555 RepID=UPI0025430903|nr:hypothetical protein [Chondrinema litorale]UZR93456.1 hypothetical protein OQ292_16500 [Chondrinema litorale]
MNQNLAKAVKANSAKRNSIDYKDAKSIGIYFNASEEEHSSKINNFVKELKSEGKSVEAITYLNSSQDNPYNFQYHVLKDEDITMFGKINAEKINKFIDKEFDYLYCICTDLQTPVKYLMAASKARCRVGTYAEENSGFFELMVGNKNNNNLTELIKNMVHYSHAIKSVVA